MKPKTPTPKELLKLRKVFSDADPYEEDSIKEVYYFEIYHRDVDNTYWSVLYRTTTRDEVIESSLLKGYATISLVSSVQDEILMYAVANTGCSIKLPGSFVSSSPFYMTATDKKKSLRGCAEC